MASGWRYQRRRAGAVAELAGSACGGGERRVFGQAAGEQSVCPEAPALQAAREGGDLALHERRSERGRSVRLQGRTRQVRGPGARRQRCTATSSSARVIPGRSCRARSSSSVSDRVESWCRRCFRTSGSMSTTSRSFTRCSAVRTITCRRITRCSRGKSAWDSRAPAPGSRMAWVPRAPACRRSSSLPTPGADRLAGRPTGARATCRPRIRERCSARAAIRSSI